MHKIARSYRCFCGRRKDDVREKKTERKDDDGQQLVWGISSECHGLVHTSIGLSVYRDDGTAGRKKEIKEERNMGRKERRKEGRKEVRKEGR